MSTRDLHIRTLEFAVAVVRWAKRQPRHCWLDPLVRQLVKAGTGAGANYRAARRGRSYREFGSRLAVAVEEVDESVYWLTLLRRVLDTPDRELGRLLSEAEELRAILGTALVTARTRLRTESLRKP